MRFISQSHDSGEDRLKKRAGQRAKRNALGLDSARRAVRNALEEMHWRPPSFLRQGKQKAAAQMATAKANAGQKKRRRD
jgi:hypothetical protein